LSRPFGSTGYGTAEAGGGDHAGLDTGAPFTGVDRRWLRKALEADDDTSVTRDRAAARPTIARDSVSSWR
jgi:hypothetical protein